jgi:cytochrome c oxidase subunit IV
MVTIIYLAESSDCYSTCTNLEDRLIMINLMLKATLITYLYLSFLCKCVQLAHLYKALHTPLCHLISVF